MAAMGGTGQDVRNVLLVRALSRRGLRGLEPHRVTRFWIGLGRRPRTPGRRLLERLRRGEFTDVLDIGVAGALDPRLEQGDLVLSSREVPFDAREALAPRRRPELEAVARSMALERGVSLQAAAVLTHERALLSRRDRLAWFERTGCAAVQMEHAWAVQLLRSLLPAAVFDGMCFTHLAMISDAVPAGDGRLAAWGSGVRALGAYLSQRGIRRLRRDFLRRWLTPGGK